MSEKVDVTQIFRVSKNGDTLYLNVSKLARTFGWKKGDKLRVQIKEKILETY